MQAGGQVWDFTGNQGLHGNSGWRGTSEGLHGHFESPLNPKGQFWDHTGPSLDQAVRAGCNGGGGADRATRVDLL